MRCHAIESDDPLVEGRGYEAICGATVPEAYFLASFSPLPGMDVRHLGESYFSLGQCKKCLSVDWKLRRRYWAINGQEAK